MGKVFIVAVVILNSLAVLFLPSFSLFLAPVVSMILLVSLLALYRWESIKDAKIINEVLHQYAKGNFLAENEDKLRLRHNQDTLVQIMAMQKTMKDWLYNILQSEIQLSLCAKRLENNAEDSFHHMHLIAGQIQQIQGDSHKISNASMENAAVSQEIQSANEQMAQFSQDYMGVTQNSLKTMKSSKETIVKALEGVAVIEEQMKATVEKVNALDYLMGAIHQMTSGISKISDQTNLLALNASIESARAGEAGRGFAVVANEVTKLADESSKIAEDIKASIRGMEQSIKEVVGEIKEAVDSTYLIKQSNMDAVGSLDEIVNHAEGMLGFIRSISDSIQEQLRASEVLSGNVEKLAEIATSSASATIHASADISEQRAKTKENRQLSSEVQSVSKHLNAYVRQFDTSLNVELYHAGEVLADMIAAGKVDNNYLTDFSKQTGISEFYITDENGVTVLSNNPMGIGFKIENDPKTQAYVFYQILNDPNKRVAQEMTVRDIDGKTFKFVGLSRKDKRGIIQLGLAIEDILTFRGQYALK